MTDGIIELNTKRAKELGFTSDRFLPLSYLWKTKNRIMISAIESREKGKGYFSELLNKIWSKGFTVAVPTPSGRMMSILIKKKFKKTIEGEYEVWIK